MIHAVKMWWLGASAMGLLVTSQVVWAQGARPAGAGAARNAARPTTSRAARPAAGGTLRASGCSAQDLKRLRALVIRAASEYDGYDYESAKATLNDAIAIAEGKGCRDNSDAVRAYIYLGVVYVAGYRDMDAGKKAWFKALAIDPSVEVPRRMATPRLLRAFAAVKAQYKVQAPARPGGGPPRAAARPAGPPKGLEHAPVTEAVEAKPLTIGCRTGDALQAAKVMLYYKPSFGVSYRELPMTRDGRWGWKATIPGKFVIGKALRYFLVVYDAKGRPVAASGNAASPHLSSIKAEDASAASREENPLERQEGGASRPRVAHRRETPDADRVEVPGARKVSSGARRPEASAQRGPVTARTAMFRVSAGLGGGFGMLNGVTEVARKGYDFNVHEDLPTAMSSGSLYGQFVLGYLMNPNMVLSVLGRMGKMFISKDVLDQGAGNYYDWLVLLRFRYQSAALPTGLDGLGWRWFAGGGIGYGVIRHHIKAKDVQVVEGQRVDVTDTDLAKGVVPDLFGGAELVFFDGYLSLFLEANYLAAFSGDTDNNLYLHVDFTMGLATQF